jgi:hypothetical protein
MGANLLTIMDDCYLNLYKVDHWSTQLIDTWTHMRHNLNIEHKFKTKKT